MRIPFTVEQFLGLFARYNAAIWPAQVGAYGIGLAVLWLALRGGRRAASCVPWLLAGLWAIVGAAYHLAFFAEINPAAPAFGLAFLVQAALFGRAAQARRLAFGWAPGRCALAGLAIVGYALVAYPLLGAAAGHPYPTAPVFGVTPCPTVIFTFGILLLAAGPVPWWLLVLPILWALVGSAAALQLGMREDLGLPIAGALTVLFQAAGAERRGESIAP